MLSDGMDLDLLNHAVVVLVDLWNLHLKEPWWVVGEHKHWPPPFGEVIASDPFPPLPLGDVVVTAILPFEAISLVQRGLEPREVVKNPNLTRKAFGTIYIDIHSYTVI